MKYLTFSFTNNAAKIAQTIHTCLVNRGDSCISYTTCKSYHGTTLIPLTIPLKEQLGQYFDEVDCIVFISACGIAVRTIAPFIKNKCIDPCVLVIDEVGHYVISLLSGHIGGGNEQTNDLARLIGAVPIITTATDLHHLFSIDTFAIKNNLYIENMTICKEISRSLLNKEPVGIHSDFDIQGALPDYLVRDKEKETSPPRIGFTISLNSIKSPYMTTLHLIPRKVILGIGCRKNIPCDQLEASIHSILAQHNISIYAVKEVASIDIKAKELGLLQFCNTNNIPFKTYSATKLNSLTDCYTSSKFVQSITGTDNVCERAAKFCCPEGTFLFRKVSQDGVTVAAILSPFTLSFYNL